MKTESTKASLAGSEVPAATKARSEPERAMGVGEGLGVFRALLLTALFYTVVGTVLWSTWHAFVHWRGH